ncbi:MAG: hypothetical protein RIE56_06665 [Amphiplicatus sp.]
MGAKHYAIVGLAALTAAAPACTSLKRLAPPGILKYEELAGDQPVNPEIKQRIVERRQEIDRRFPNLSEQPTKRPAEAPAAEREALAADLIEARDQLQAAVEADRAASDSERQAVFILPGDKGDKARALEDVAADLAAEVENDGTVARRERSKPMPQPAPQQDDQ